MTQSIPLNLMAWIKDHRDLLKPPVGNKMIWEDTDFLVMIDDFDTDKAEQHIRELANPAEVLTLSVRQPDSLGGWLDLIRQQLQARQGGEQLHPKIQSSGTSPHLAV